MKKIQIQKIKRWLRTSQRLSNVYRNDKVSENEYTQFMKDLSTHLMGDLSRDLILKIQRVMIDNFKNSINSFAAFCEARVLTDYTSIALPVQECEDEFKKRIIEGHILFYVGNHFLPMNLEDKDDRYIFNLLSLVDKRSKIYDNFTEQYYALINMIKYSYDIDREFTDSIVNFLKDYDASELKIKEQLNLIYHMMLRYSGVKVDYLKMIKMKADGNSCFNISLGDLLSQDYNYYLYRYNSEKRKSGYMYRRREVLISSFDNDVLNHELATLAGKLSSSEQYSFCSYLRDKDNMPDDKKKFSKYISKIMLASKNAEAHYGLIQYLTDEDFAFCLPVLIQSSQDHYYATETIKNRMKQIEKGNE